MKYCRTEKWGGLVVLAESIFQTVPQNNQVEEQ